jgi:hypothetical protein
MPFEQKTSFGTFSPKIISTFFQTTDFCFDLSQKKTPPKSRTSIKTVPTHVYLKNNIYYFRYAFPLVYKKRLGYSEVRLSLRTGYKRQAQEYARILYGNLMELLMVTPELDCSTIKIRLNNLLLKLMKRIDHEDNLKLSVPLTSPGTKPVLSYPDLSKSREIFKEVSNGILVQLDEDRVLTQLNEDGALSELETSKNRETIIRSYEWFYNTLRSYAHAHLKRKVDSLCWTTERHF